MTVAKEGISFQGSLPGKYLHLIFNLESYNKLILKLIIF